MQVVSFFFFFFAIFFIYFFFAYFFSRRSVRVGCPESTVHNYLAGCFICLGYRSE